MPDDNKQPGVVTDPTVVAGGTPAPTQVTSNVPPTDTPVVVNPTAPVTEVPAMGAPATDAPVDPLAPVAPVGEVKPEETPQA